jgi:hypothetical protein
MKEEGEGKTSPLELTHQIFVHTDKVAAGSAGHLPKV